MSLSTIRIGAAALNQTPLDWSGNRRNIVSAIIEARSNGVQLLVLPELCVTGYGCEDAFLSKGVRDKALVLLSEISQHSKGIAVTLGLPLEFRGTLYNSVAFLVDGEIAGFVCKQFLAKDGIHYEPRWFVPWQSGRRESIQILGTSYPLGDLIFNLNGIRIGFEVCEDAWVKDRPARFLSERGAVIVLNPSASHFAFGKVAIRNELILSASAKFKLVYAFANLVGNEAGRAIYDGMCVIANCGKTVAFGRRFTFDDTALIAADVTPSAGVGSEISFKFPELEVKLDYSLNAKVEHEPLNALEPWENSSDIKAEEFARAVGLGLFDYLRKSRSNGFVVSASGGADSSSIICLIYIMVQFAVKELGLDRFKAKLSYLESIQEKSDPKGIVAELLTAVYQAAEHSSETTRLAAKGVSEAVGATYFELSVGGIVDQYVSVVEKALGKKLSWQNDDLALQNIQARVRAPSVWLIANLKGALLLATSNRSEAAVGYTTMDGDTCGGLSPVAGIDKAYLRKWMIWFEKKGPLGIGPMTQLSAVNSQEPTAELRPKELAQTDESDLMPYEVLDQIERLAIRDKLFPKEVFQRIIAEFPSYQRDQIRGWIILFFTLWSRNQWKRERYAPSFHLDEESLDPKTWCRFPILSGGYAEELANLGE